MSNESAASVKEQVRKDWAEGARAWGKWRRELTSQSKEATDVLIEAAQLRPGMRVLDIASGTGEPALSIATALGAKGEVVATDLTTEMLAVAEADAHERRLKNVRFQQADAEALPFPDESFDRVTCRFGIMFCPRPGQALREMRRVLKPGGRVALVTWGPPDKNPFFATAMGPFMKRLPMPPPDPDAPSPFRFAQPAGTSVVVDQSRRKERDMSNITLLALRSAARKVNEDVVACRD
ncbi:MAG: class I SAM-dependent methyltransferase, partial [Chloroflexi bacterium]|nr:class I SAM-dependent methyltransferase [Chloroflexota bacterium]